MRFLIIGAGGIGGYFGARLIAAGHDVLFAQRGDHGKALGEHGLKVSSALGDLALGPQRLWDGKSAADRDVVILATKLAQVKDTAQSLKGKLGAETFVVPLQNGVTAEDWVAEILGADRVVAGVARISAEITKPGHIRHVGNFAELIFGETGGGESARVLALVEAFKAAGVKAWPSATIQVDLWTKFVLLTTLSGATGFYRSGIGAVLSNDEGLATVKALLGEAGAVARAQGIALSPGLEEKLLGFLGSVPPETKASMLVDLERGKPLELPFLSGEVARRGKALGVATPISDKVVQKLMPFVGGDSSAA